MLDLFHSMDYVACRKYWAEHHPELLQPKNDAEAEILMHMAITLSNEMPIAKRYYSHWWLTDRSYPSHLPSELVAKLMGIEVIDFPVIGVAVASMHLPESEVIKIRDNLLDKARNMSEDKKPMDEIRRELNKWQ